MVSKLKNIIKDIVFSLLIMFFITVSGNYVSQKAINNDFFMKHINEIKSHDNIVNRFMLFLEEDSLFLVRRYIEAVVDSFIEFEQLPSFDDLKYSFELIISSLENDIVVKNIEIRSNRIILMCELGRIGNINEFMMKIKAIKYIDSIFYNDYLIDGNRYKMKIYCIHNNKN